MSGKTQSPGALSEFKVIVIFAKARMGHPLYSFLILLTVAETLLLKDPVIIFWSGTRRPLKNSKPFCGNCQLCALPHLGITQYKPCIEQAVECYANLIFFLSMWKHSICGMILPRVCISHYCVANFPLFITPKPVWFLFLEVIVIPSHLNLRCSSLLPATMPRPKPHSYDWYLMNIRFQYKNIFSQSSWHGSVVNKSD